MATVSRNINLRETFDGRLHVPIVAGTVINQGDALCWDNTLAGGNGAARVVAAQADMANFLGFAVQQDPVASIGDSLNTIEIVRSGIVRMKTTPAETYKHFQKLYFNETLDAQTITNNTNSGARTVGVGFAQIPQEPSMNGVTTWLGAVGTDIDVLITPNFPAASI